MPPQIKEITELDFSSPDSVDLDLYEISDLDFEELHKIKVLQRFEDRKNPDFLDLFLKEIRSSLIGRGITSFARLGEYISEKPTYDPQLEAYLSSGDTEKVKSYLENQENLKRIKQIYSINKNNRSMIEEIGTSFIENLLPDYIDNVGDDRVLKIQEEVNDILESNGFEPINFDNELSFTQNLGKAIGVTAASIPYYFIGGLLTSPSRAAALAKIIKVANPTARASLNAIQNIANTAVAFSAAEVLHSGFDPKNIMLNGVAQGSGEAVAEMALYPILSKVLGKGTAKYATRLLANSTTEFFQELTGQYFSTGKLPDVETVGMTAILSGLFSVAARRGMEVDILNVYNNAVKERERLLKKREKNPDSFTEEDLKVLNEVNNLAEAIKNNADNWRLKNKFEEFVNKRKIRDTHYFEKAKKRLESLSTIAGALSTEFDIEGLTKDPKKLVKYLESKGFTEEEIIDTPPEYILADPRFNTKELLPYYYEIFQAFSGLQKELTDPKSLGIEEDLFGIKTEKKLGIGVTEEEIREIKEIDEEAKEEFEGEVKEEFEEKVEEEIKEEVEEEEEKLGQDIVDNPDPDKTRIAVRKGLTLTDEEVKKFLEEIERGYKKVAEDVKEGREVKPEEIFRLQALREAVSAKTGKSINYDPETGFSEVPLEKNKLLYDIVKEETTKSKDETGIFVETGGKKIKLNEQQVTALNKIEKWSKGTGGIFTLSGYPGTGKTTIIKHFIDNLEGNVVVSAPTHKAVSVISKATGKDGYTLQFLLGLEPDVYLEEFDPKKPIFAQKNRDVIEDFDYIIIDEASMINEELYKFLKDKYKHKHIIFIGDPAQPPPVNETKSKVFTDVTNENIYELTKVERQSDTNPIFLVLDDIRSDINSTTDKFKHETKLNSKGEGIEFLKEKSFFEKLDQYIPEIKKNPYLYKVLSWRNSEVSKYNKYIRDKIFNNPKDILVNRDFLIVYNSIDNYRGDFIVNSAEYIVTGIRPGTKLGIEGYIADFHLAEKFTSERDFPIAVFFIVDHNNEESLNKFKNELKRKLSIARTLKGKAWFDYFKFKREFLLMKDLYDGGKFLVGKDLDYGYSITVHRSQGSTYETVFVDENDINMNKVPAERNQLKYVAFSRASKNLIVRNDALGSEKKPAETKEEKPKPRKAKLPSGEIVDIVEHPTIESIALTRKDIEETINTYVLPTESVSPVDIPQANFTQKEIDDELPSAEVREPEVNVGESTVKKEPDGRDEENFEEDDKGPSKNGLIVTRIINQEDVNDSITLSGWLAARKISVMPSEIEVAAMNKDFPTFVKSLAKIIGEEKFKTLNYNESTLRRVWFKSKDKIVRNNFIAEAGKGITLNTSRSPGGNFINRVDNASQLDLLVNEYNSKNPNDKIDLYYFDGYFVKEFSEKSRKSYYKTLSNAFKSVKEKQKEFLKHRFIFYSTASDGRKEVWIQASEDVWNRFADGEEAAKFYNERKDKYRLPDLTKYDNARFLATRLYYFEKMDSILRTGLSDANFTKRAQIYMASGGRLTGLDFIAEFKAEDAFYSFDPKTHNITRGKDGEKEAHDGAIYLTLSEMKKVAEYTGEVDKRVLKPFAFGFTEDGRTYGLKCAAFVAPPEMEAEMKKAGVNMRVYLSAEKLGQIKDGEIHKIEGKNIVLKNFGAKKHNEATMTRAIFPTLPVDYQGKRPTDVFNKFVNKRVSQFTDLIHGILIDANRANVFLRRLVKYTGNSKYENIGRMLEMGLSWHPDIIKVVKDIFKNKYINDNLMKFKRKGTVSNLMPDHTGDINVGECSVPSFFATDFKKKIGDYIVVNRSPSARVDNFRVVKIKKFHSEKRYGNTIILNGGETIFYQESDYDIDEDHVIVDMTPEEIDILQTLSKAVGVVPVEKNKKVDNIWDVNQQWAVQSRFSAGKMAIGEITNIQTIYSMLIQNKKALQVSPDEKVVVVDLDYAMQNRDNYYLIPKYQDIIEMQKYIAPIHQASVDNAKLDALSTIMDGKPYTRNDFIKSLFDVIEPKVKPKVADDFDPVLIGFNSNASPMKHILNVLRTFTKDWDDGGSSWSYDDQHNAIMAYKNAAKKRTGGAGETLFPNSPLHNFFMNYPEASLTNGGYYNTPIKRGAFVFRDYLRLHHYETMEAAFRKDINRLDPYKGGKISHERNEQMTDVIIKIFDLKDKHYKGEIPTNDRVEVTLEGVLNRVEGYHTKVKKLIEDLKMNADERLWFDLKMLNNFDGIQSQGGKFKGNLSPQQLKETLLRDYDTRREFLTKQEGKEYKQLNKSVFFYPKSREEAFNSRYEPYFISIAISDETLKKYSSVYNNFYNMNVRKKREISSGFLAESKGSLSIGINPYLIMDTFSDILKSANKYLNPKNKPLWWKWFAENKHAEITNKQIAKINDLLDRVYGTEVWGDKTVTDFIVHTLTEGTGSRPATRARLDFDKVPITIEEGNMIILELESIYRQLNTSKPNKIKQSVFLTKELLYKHPITKKFYDTLSSEFKKVNKYAAELFLDIESIEKGSFKIDEPANIPFLSVKSPYSSKITRNRINAYHRLYRKFMELKIRRDMGEKIDNSEIDLAEKACKKYLEKNQDIKNILDLMRGIATIHQEISEAAIIGATIVKNNSSLKKELIKEGIIPSNFSSEAAFWNRVLDYIDKKGIKYSTNIYDPVYDIAKRAEIRKKRKEYEDRWKTKIDMPDEQLFITIDRMDKAAKTIYDFDKETFDNYIAPRKEELRQQITLFLSGEKIDLDTANKIADKLLSFIPKDFKRIDRYFPWINFDFQIERQYSIWNLDDLAKDVESGALNLDDWINKPSSTGFFKPRREDWQVILKEGMANIPWDIPEVLRVRMLASMNVRKISAIRKDFADLFKEIRSGILSGKLTPREVNFFAGIERLLNVLKYDLQSIPWARRVLKYGTFNGDYSNNDYLHANEIKESKRNFYTNVDLWSKIYRNVRTFAFLGLEQSVSIRNVISQGIMVAGSDLGYKRVMSAVSSLLRPGGIKSGGAIVSEKVNGEIVTVQRLMKDLALDHDDILAQIENTHLPTRFSILKDIDKSHFTKLTEKFYKFSGQMANWSLEHINWGGGFAKSFFGIPLSFRDSEIYLNRLATAKAAVQKAWEDFDKRGVSITPEEKYAKALAYARKKVDEIHFDYGLLNRPDMMRHKMGASLFIFRSFTWNQINMFWSWAREWKHVPNWENSRRLIYFSMFQALGVMVKTYIGIEFIRFFDWALGDLTKDFWNYIRWLVFDDERALNEIGFGGTKKIRDTFPDIDPDVAAAIAATNHIFTGIVPDMIQLWLFINSDEDVNAPWDLSKRNRNLLALYQAGGLKQPIKVSKFYENLEKTTRAMRSGIDPKYPDETMKPSDFIQWYLINQMLGNYIPYPEYNTILELPADIGLPNLKIK